MNFFRQILGKSVSAKQFLISIVNFFFKAVYCVLA